MAARFLVFFLLIYVYVDLGIGWMTDSKRYQCRVVPIYWVAALILAVLSGVDPEFPGLMYLWIAWGAGMSAILLAVGVMLARELLLDSIFFRGLDVPPR